MYQRNMSIKILLIDGINNFYYHVILQLHHMRFCFCFCFLHENDILIIMSVILNVVL